MSIADFENTNKNEEQIRKPLVTPQKVVDVIMATLIGSLSRHFTPPYCAVCTSTFCARCSFPGTRLIIKL